MPLQGPVLPMRIVLAAGAGLLAVLLVAGPALASDYMLPVLLEPTETAVPGAPSGSSQQAQSLPPPAAGSGASMGFALVGAAVVTGATLLFLTRRPAGA